MKARKNKDSATSWEQRSWETAAQFHTLYTRLHKDACEPRVKLFCEQRIAEYERRFPQLKGDQS